MTPKPCPFCGSTPRKDDTLASWIMAHAATCYFSGRHIWSIAGDTLAIRRWNKRGRR